MADEKQQTEERQEPRDMTGWSEEEIERGSTFVERFMSACRDVKAMRDGLKPERDWREVWAELQQEIAEEERLEREAEQLTMKRAGRA